jgi:hypothetical protein
MNFTFLAIQVISQLLLFKQQYMFINDDEQKLPTKKITTHQTTIIKKLPIQKK